VGAGSPLNQICLAMLAACQAGWLPRVEIQLQKIFPSCCSFADRLAFLPSTHEEFAITASRDIQLPLARQVWNLSAAPASAAAELAPYLGSIGSGVNFQSPANFSNPFGHAGETYTASGPLVLHPLEDSGGYTPAMISHFQKDAVPGSAQADIGLLRARVAMNVGKALLQGAK
jgi:hypothetical protein